MSNDLKEERAMLAALLNGDPWPNLSESDKDLYRLGASEAIRREAQPTPASEFDEAGEIASWRACGIANEAELGPWVWKLDAQKAWIARGRKSHDDIARLTAAYTELEERAKLLKQDLVEQSKRRQVEIANSERAIRELGAQLKDARKAALEEVARALDKFAPDIGREIADQVMDYSPVLNEFFAVWGSMTANDWDRPADKEPKP